MKARSGFLKKWFTHQVIEPPTAPLQVHIPVDYTPTPSLAHVPTDYRRPVWQLSSLRRRIRAAAKLLRTLPEWTVPSKLPIQQKVSAFPRRVPTHPPASLISPIRSPQASSSRISSTSSASSMSSSSSTVSRTVDSRGASLSAHSSMTSLHDMGELNNSSLQTVDKPADGYISNFPFHDFSETDYEPSPSIFMNHQYQRRETVLNPDLSIGFTSIFDTYDIPSIPLSS